jgi:SSS family solute:Na+ symporter
MCFIAVFLLVWGLWYPLGERLWDYMAVTGAIYFTGAFATLVAGIYWKRASKAGAYAAFACGFLMIFALSPVQNLLHIKLLTQTIGLSTAALAMISMIVVSLCFPDRKVVE